jgi:hypothetical protein
MAQAFSHEVLSSSTNGLGIKIDGATSGNARTLHTAIAGTTSRDEVWIWLQNNNASGVSRTVTIEFGGTTAVDNQIILSVPPKSGPVLAVPGFPLRNTLLVKAFADVANEVVVYGYVNRVTVT